jgi:hypothetical protein
LKASKLKSSGGISTINFHSCFHVVVTNIDSKKCSMVLLFKHNLVPFMCMCKFRVLLHNM